MTVWHGCCLHIVWHASLFGWTLYIVCLKQREIFIMPASWHAATMLTKISFVYRAKIAYPCYHHYAGNPVEGHKFKDLQHNPTKSREESQSTYHQKWEKSVQLLMMQLFTKSYRVDLLLAFYMAFLKFIRLAVLSTLLFHRLTPMTTIWFLPCFYASANLNQPIHWKRQCEWVLAVFEQLSQEY